VFSVVLRDAFICESAFHPKTYSVESFREYGSVFSVVSLMVICVAVDSCGYRSQ
jgi:hypothetical protein